MFVRIGKIIGLSTYIIPVFVIHFITNQGIQMMVFRNRRIIRQLISPYQLAALVDIGIHNTVFIFTIRCMRVIPTLALSSRIIIADRSLELEVRNELIFRINRIEMTSNVFVFRIIHHRQQRVTVADTNQVTVPSPVFVINRIGRRHTTTRAIEGRSIRSALTIYILRHMREKQISTDSQLITCLKIRIQTGTETFQTRVERNTLLIQIRNRSIILEAVGTS